MTPAVPADGPDEGLVVDVLGAGSGYPTAERDTTSLLIGAGGDWSLIDCPGSLVHKLARRGMEPAELRRVVLTHDHVDHVYGLPHLLHALAIAGVDEPLPVVAPAQTLATVQAMVEAHGLVGAGRVQVRMIEIPLEEGARLGERASSSAGTSSPGAPSLRFTPTEHGRDTVAVRVDVRGASLCHSSDTRASDAVVRLARRADMLFHDCGGPDRERQRFGDNHASAAEAGQAAAAADVGTLVLIHLGVTGEDRVQECIDEAARHFEGTVLAAEDGARWHLPPGT